MLEHGVFSVVQPKTGKVRALVLTQAAKKALTASWTDVLSVFESNDNKPLGSIAGSDKLMRKDDWIKVTNDALRPAAKHFGLKSENRGRSLL